MLCCPHPRIFAPKVQNEALSPAASAAELGRRRNAVTSETLGGRTHDARACGGRRGGIVEVPDLEDHLHVHLDVDRHD